MDTKQKKGSSEEKVWKDYLNHVKKKQKRGCGKPINDTLIDCGMYVFGLQLCPSCSTLAEEHRKCSNQSPTLQQNLEDTPEEDSLGVTRKESKVSNTDSSGTQSPQEYVQLGKDKIPFIVIDNKDTFNLSDEISECDCDFTWVDVKDVQEFIRRLKEELNVQGKTLVPVEIIDKLAGSKLVKGGVK